VIAAINSFNHTKTGFEKEIKLFGECFGNAEMTEGVTAFLEKRKPKFS
jgi:enoyl-CoA hydratase